MHECELFYACTVRFQPLIQDLASLLSNGKAAIDYVEAVNCIARPLSDGFCETHTCPLTTRRMKPPGPKHH